jgi:NAD(P)-dependent dehydrogenase (short-subunit alcohol dehydrogenase family)
MENHAAFSPGNVAVISGAADGIGKATAQRMASFGMHVVMADIAGDKLAAAGETVRAIAAAHKTEVITQTVNVAEFEQVTALKENAYATFGRVDVLMNNAGTSQPSGSWKALSAWRTIIDVNLWGIIHGMQAFTEAMLAQNSPALIINTGSKQGITNPPGNPAYNVSKAGVKAATESLQHELRNLENCRLSAHLLVPGYTFTGLTHLGLAQSGIPDKPPAAWLPEQVSDYMVEAINRGSFYIICPDNEVSREDDARRMLWAAGDLAYDRPPLSRWDADYSAAFAAFNASDTQ